MTTAVKLPADGTVEKVIDNDVLVAEDTVPMAPLLKTTVLLAAVLLKPVPAIVIVVALIARLAVLLVTTGLTEATCTAVPLLKELVVTDAVKSPATVGLVPNVTVKLVVLAVVTVPTAPLLNVTVLLPAVVLNPKPEMMTVFAVTSCDVVAAVTLGMTVAT